jgi:iron-sulfur cluster repair protein YtfE (RIC family)
MRRHAGLIPLSHEHQHALALCVMTDRALAANPGEDAVRHAVANILQTFDNEILDHFRFEEQVLFPMLERFAELADLVSELKAEHVRITGLVTELRRQADRAYLTELCSSLRDHVRKEESVLFEQAQELLSAEQLKEVGDRGVGMNREPR